MLATGQSMEVMVLGALHSTAGSIAAVLSHHPTLAFLATSAGSYMQTEPQGRAGLCRPLLCPLPEAQFKGVTMTKTGGPSYVGRMKRVGGRLHRSHRQRLRLEA